MGDAALWPAGDWRALLIRLRKVVWAIHVQEPDYWRASSGMNTSAALPPTMPSMRTAVVDNRRHRSWWWPACRDRQLFTNTLLKELERKTSAAMVTSPAVDAAAAGRAKLNGNRVRRPTAMPYCCP